MDVFWNAWWTSQMRSNVATPIGVGSYWLVVPDACKESILVSITVRPILKRSKLNNPLRIAFEFITATVKVFVHVIIGMFSASNVCMCFWLGFSVPSNQTTRWVECWSSLIVNHKVVIVSCAMCIERMNMIIRILISHRPTTWSCVYEIL